MMHYLSAEPWEVWPLIRDFHYSRRMPSAIQGCYVARQDGGLFGDCGEITAAVIFSISANKWKEEVIELSRLVKVDVGHSDSLTKLIAFGCKNMKKRKFDLLISYADEEQNHKGFVYQAASWKYHEKRKPQSGALLIDGKYVHGRTCSHLYGTRSAALVSEKLKGVSVEPHWGKGKHLYWRALNKAGQRKAERLGLQSRPYPKAQDPDHGKPGP